MARAQINHATDSRAASRHTATSSPRVDIWIRMTGTRRQAFYRCRAAGVANWQAMGVPLANKALKLGSISLPGIADATVEAYTESAPAHPMAAEFAERARALNSEIDALNLSARGDA
ncbi:hypothetical protein J2W28_000204 [Variovorax boronicumulans]|uniref:hypothetical protein n=1 Tax=Variovorax boronicumulans TaxID=436515 RepID=UPI00277F45D3|nr:hypothetical protein [Variovorax boronicumulans]MDP9990413.1 hypothetical protein [Variovorax boronicumulans]MDQ0001076.1 hypothetical protein [Variovorax boronicumulans]